MSDTTRVFAPAKINLALHVVGQRDDGYHLLETLAVFADAGDRLTLEPSDTDTFAVNGPEAAALSGEDPASNLVCRARDLVRRHAGIATPPVALTLDKHLPAGAGIGGGSADAAAAIRALAAHWGLDDTAREAIRREAAGLGADVPMCLVSRPLVARGIGEAIAPVTPFPALPAVLVNPRRHVSTPAVFAALEARENPPLPAVDGHAAVPALAEWLATHTRNDLQETAMKLHPVIRDCLSALEATGALMTRMSGSGATCFGLYGDDRTAARAAEALAEAHPSWWIRAVRTSAGQEEAQP